MHFARPDFFESIVPDWFPNRRSRTTGAVRPRSCSGSGCFRPAPGGRRHSASIALLAAVFPANIDMALNDVEVKPVDGKMSRSAGTAVGPGRIVNWVRLPLQLPIAVALWRIARQAPAVGRALRRSAQRSSPARRA